MYYTVQIKLRTDEEQHEILQQYEYIYLSELQRLITKMVNLKKKQRFSSFQYSPCIEKSCRWMLYTVATKIATAKIENRTTTKAAHGPPTPLKSYITIYSYPVAKASHAKKSLSHLP